MATRPDVAEVQSVIPSHVIEMIAIAIDKKALPEGLGQEGLSIDLLLMKAGITSDEALKDALLTIFLTDPEVMQAVGLVLMVEALGPKIDPRHLPVLQPLPRNQTAFVQADIECDVGCPGSYPHPSDSAWANQPLCRSVGQIERWANCLRYREVALATEQRDTTERIGGNDATEG
jgi:hypothetical protein